MNGTARRLLAKHLFLALASQVKSKSSHLNSSSATGPGLAVLWSARGYAAEQKEQVLGRVLINPALQARLSQCPLRSESDRIAASLRNDAVCQNRTNAPQQKNR